MLVAFCDVEDCGRFHAAGCAREYVEVARQRVDEKESAPAFAERIAREMRDAVIAASTVVNAQHGKAVLPAGRNEYLAGCVTYDVTDEFAEDQFCAVKIRVLLTQFP